MEAQMPGPAWFYPVMEGTPPEMEANAEEAPLSKEAEAEAFS